MLIQLKNVSKFYYSSNVVSAGFTNLSCSFDLGEFVVITGQSGSGKSTLLNVISGLDNYQEGEMFVNGEDTSGYSDKEIEEYRKKYISNIFQNFNLVSSYSVYKNIALNLIVQGESKYKNKVNEAIKKVGLWKYRNTKASKLSGGQKQRVAIARALVRETPIIVADEPTGDLDEENAKEILKLFSEISKDKLVIIVTHNYSQVEQYATRKIQMSDGHIIEDVILKEHENVEKITVKENTKMKVSSTIELAFMNTFNVFAKFMLLLLVFLYLSISVIGLYSTYKISMNESTSSYSYYFSDEDQTRFILKKKDNSYFLNKDLIIINRLEYVSNIEINDLLLDYSLTLTDNKTTWLNGDVKKLSEISEVTEGRMPKNSNEVVIAYNKNDDWIIDEIDFNDNNYYCYINSRYQYKETAQQYQIVGAIASDEVSYYNYNFYFVDDELSTLRLEIEKTIGQVTSSFKTFDLNNYQVICLDTVTKGQAYITNDINEYLCNVIEKESILNEKVSLNNTSLYYSKDKELTISNVINEENCSKYLGINPKELENGTIYINTSDYDSLFSTDNYQISIFVDDIKNVDLLKEELDKTDFNYLYVKDTISTDSDFDVLSQMFVGFSIAIGLIGLFFIAYFIIRIILKSRNTYFAIVRMLGATKKNIRSLIVTELIIVMNISYGLVLLGEFILYLNKELLEKYGMESILDTLSYYSFKDYIILYVILITLSLLIGLKYSKKLYSSSAISIYKDGD